MRCFSLGAERLKGNVDLFLNPMWSGARMPSEAEAGRVLGEAGEGAHSAETRGALQVHRTAMGIRKQCIAQGNSSQGTLISAKSPCFLEKFSISTSVSISRMKKLS